LEDNEFAVEKRQAILADMIAASRTEDGETRFGDWQQTRQPVKEKASVGILTVGRSPVQPGRDRAGIRSGGDERPSHKLSG
jgi:hypothetical protein